MPSEFAEKKAAVFYGTTDAASIIGVHPDTLKIWEQRGWLVPPRTTSNRRRLYDPELVAQGIAIRRRTKRVGCELVAHSAIPREIQVLRSRARAIPCLGCVTLRASSFI